MCERNEISDAGGNYRFKRVRDGKLAFAHVYVEAVKRDDGVFIVSDATAMNSDTIERRAYPEFVDAAMLGCRRAVAWLRTLPWPCGFDIRLTKVQIIVVDTREDAVECAAFLATANAFSRGNEVDVIFENGRWHVGGGSQSGAG